MEHLKRAHILGHRKAKGLVNFKEYVSYFCSKNVYIYTHTYIQAWKLKVIYSHGINRRPQWKLLDIQNSQLQLLNIEIYGMQHTQRKQGRKERKERRWKERRKERRWKDGSKDEKRRKINVISIQLKNLGENKEKTQRQQKNANIKYKYNVNTKYKTRKQ